MAKRFSDTEKWFDPWFWTLSERDRGVWLFILDRCDHSGIWKINIPMIQTFFPGYELNDKIFGEKVTILGPERWWIRKFIPFQYGKINPKKSQIHAKVLKNLEEQSFAQGLGKDWARVALGLGKGRARVGQG